MYDEFERAMTGRTPRRGLSVLGWVVAGFAFVVLAGVVGVAFAVNSAVDRVEDFARNLDVDQGLAQLTALADVEPQTRLLDLSPDEGIDFLASLEGRDPAGAFLAEVMPGVHQLESLESLGSLDALRELGRDDRIRRGDGDVNIRLDKRDGGGSLVIDADGEEVRFDLARTGSGGFLTVRTPEGTTRIDLVGRDEGGVLSIDGPDGKVRFDLQKRGDDGAEFRIESDEGTVRMGLGDAADAVPGWVPAFDVFPEAPRPVYSMESGQARLGAALWKGDASPADLLARFRDELEAQGYELRDRYRRTGDGVDEASFWARNEAEGRSVFVVARQEAGHTSVLVGFGQRRGEP